MNSVLPVQHVRRFGLNYVPSQKWYFLWNEWDSGVVRADFAAMASLGIDHLRVQLLWPYFQPNAGVVSTVLLRRLDELMGIAAEVKLDILLCGLTGWLSGYRFLPPNVDGSDVFLKKETFEQIQRYFTAILSTVRDRANFLGFDVGNEINVLAPHLPVRSGDAWGKRLCTWLRPKMQGKWIVNGIDHGPWFQGKTFSPRHLVREYDAVCIHAWPFFTGCMERGGLADPHSVNLAAFLARYSLCHARREHQEKPIWIQEFGCSSLWGTLGERSRYMEKTITSAVEAGATWFTWWCSHDIERSYQFAPLEYDLGLFTTKNRPKPLARLYQKLIGIHSRKPTGPSSAGPVFPRWDHDKFTPAITKTLPGSQWLRQNLHTTTWDLFEQYVNTLEKGAES